jgi:uncharacterized protein (TIGR04562 family)
MPEQKKLKQQFLEYPKELFDVVLSKKSFVDVERLYIKTFEEATNYIRNYGYDMDNKAQKEQVVKILSESKQFIQSYLLEDPENSNNRLVIPPNILYEDDIRNFLVMASDNVSLLTQNWSCAILRVAHTITHVENDLSKYFFQGIKRQIFSRFMGHLTVTNNGEYFLGKGSNQIKLKLFEMKNEKSKESLTMKLLHKKENIAADVFDRVGVRIVTFDKVDIMLVLRYLEENYVLSLANIKPSRTRNNLIDFNHFLQGVEFLKSKPNLTEQEIRTELKKYCNFDEEKQQIETNRILKEKNPHSSTAYSSIQITSRQMITIQDPFIPTSNYQFFFPFEIQILDQESYEESRNGRASHDIYKKNQLKSVRNRVFYNLLKNMKKKDKRGKNV